MDSATDAFFSIAGFFAIGGIALWIETGTPWGLFSIMLGLLPVYILATDLDS